MRRRHSAFPRMIIPLLLLHFIDYWRPFYKICCATWCCRTPSLSIGRRAYSATFASLFLLLRDGRPRPQRMRTQTTKATKKWRERGTLHYHRHNNRQRRKRRILMTMIISDAWCFTTRRRRPPQSRLVATTTTRSNTDCVPCRLQRCRRRPP